MPASSQAAPVSDHTHLEKYDSPCMPISAVPGPHYKPGDKAMTNGAVGLHLIF